jgi:predicted aspartyl protease
MGLFRVDCIVANVVNRARAALVPNMVVDTGAEFSWVPGSVLEQLHIRREKKDVTFIMANGQLVTRNVGFALMQYGSDFTVDQVVFGEPGDQALLGAHTLEGLNLNVDPVRKRLIAAGPLLAAKSKPRQKRAAPRKHRRGGTK